MTIAEYLGAIKSRLLTDAAVVGFQIIRERATLTDAYVRARLSLTDEEFLEFSEYVQRSDDGQINVITCSYHWAGAAGNLIRRWDNTPHFPDLPGFPHHIHDGYTRDVIPGELVNIFTVLDEITHYLSS